MAHPREVGPADLYRLTRRWLAILGGGFAPGALAGIHLAGLIFFLNPGLPFAVGPVLRGVAVYGALLGSVSLALQLPFTWRHPRRALRALPWGLTAALGLAALLDWTHASYYAYYLPTGINDRLIKTALWLSLGALIAFYTALLHSLHRRRYGLRSRLGLPLIALLSIYAMVERREAFHPRPAAAPRPAAVESGSLPRLWVIGIDSATLDAILPLAGQGRLPFFASVLQNGAYGRLESLSPVRRDALWTTLATGKYPFKHGVTGQRPYRAGFLAPGAELRLLPTGLSFRRWGTLGQGQLPAPRHPRKALALWEILPRLGVPAGVVSWPAAEPASGEAAFALADRYFQVPPEPGSAWPADLFDRGQLFRPNERDLEASLQGRFGPRPSRSLLASLTGDAWRESLALALAKQSPQVKAVFLVLPGLRQVSRDSFGGFSRVQFEGAKGNAARAAADRVTAYYAQLDAFLGEVWSGEREPRLLAVVSAYGASPVGGWPRLWQGVAPAAAVGGAFADDPDGVLLFYGDGVQPGALVTGAQLEDLAPTLLYGLGFPVARDFDGQVLTSVFAKQFLARNPLTFFPSYEGLEPGGEAGSRKGR
ncbi:MAG TPA: alkaline phosphatase family protein [Thermoanaerobaculia bacterium]|nr:alkaline phosphatase family protein [Thermoanaerobaculia bacterium]